MAMGLGGAGGAGAGASSQGLVSGHHTREGSLSSRGATRQSGAFSAYGGSQSMYTDSSGPGEDAIVQPFQAAPGALAPMRLLGGGAGPLPTKQGVGLAASASGHTGDAPIYNDGPRMTVYPEESPPSYWAGSEAEAEGARAAAAQPEKSQARY